MKKILERLKLNSERVWDCQGADPKAEFSAIHAMMKEQVEADCLFLYEALSALIQNDQISATGERSKGDTLLKDWLKELRENAGLQDQNYLKKRFFEKVGKEFWSNIEIE